MKEDRMNRYSKIVIVVSLLSLILVAGETFATSSVPADRIAVYFSRSDDNLAEMLASLYSQVPKGGYIYVATFALTHPLLVKALVDAKKRGVDVRMISDKAELKTSRDEIAMYNMQRLGVPVKTNVRSGGMHLRISIINDEYLTTGSYRYGPQVLRSPFGVFTLVHEEDLLIIPARVDKNIIQTHKGIFDQMWNDGKAYQNLK
jgi:hypothetical protein